MSQGDQDKTEQPTPHHLEEARKRGEVAKSPDVTGVVVMIAFASIVVLSGTSFAQALARATSSGIAPGKSASGGPSTPILRPCGPTPTARRVPS